MGTGNTGNSVTPIFRIYMYQNIKLYPRCNVSLIKEATERQKVGAITFKVRVGRKQSNGANTANGYTEVKDRHRKGQGGQRQTRSVKGER